jgi:hypothetical protein
VGGGSASDAEAGANAAALGAAYRALHAFYNHSAFSPSPPPAKSGAALPPAPATAPSASSSLTSDANTTKRKLEPSSAPNAAASPVAAASSSPPASKRLKAESAVVATSPLQLSFADALGPVEGEAAADRPHWVLQVLLSSLLLVCGGSLAHLRVALL